MYRVAVILLGLLAWSGTAQAQVAQQICLPISSSASGVTITKCVPISTTNPFPTQAQ